MCTGKRFALLEARTRPVNTRNVVDVAGYRRWLRRLRNPIFERRLRIGPDDRI